jgi:hypothetical protein
MSDNVAMEGQYSLYCAVVRAIYDIAFLSAIILSLSLCLSLSLSLSPSEA